MIAREFCYCRPSISYQCLYISGLLHFSSADLRKFTLASSIRGGEKHLYTQPNAPTRSGSSPNFLIPAFIIDSAVVHSPPLINASA